MEVEFKDGKETPIVKQKILNYFCLPVKENKSLWLRKIFSKN